MRFGLGSVILIFVRLLSEKALSTPDYHNSIQTADMMYKGADSIHNKSVPKVRFVKISHLERLMKKKIDAHQTHTKRHVRRTIGHGMRSGVQTHASRALNARR